MNPEHDELFKRGLKGEDLVRAWLELRGFYVLPVSKINNKGAPMFNGLKEKIIASDSLISGHGYSYWAEIKTYQRATWSMKYQRFEHGVTIRHYEHYLKGERETGIPGYLFILQINEKLILEGKISNIIIGSHKELEHYPPSGPQIFFDVRRFQHYSLDTLMDLDVIDSLMPETLEPVTIRPWEKNKRMPKYQQIPFL